MDTGRKQKCFLKNSVRFSSLCSMFKCIQNLILFSLFILCILFIRNVSILKFIEITVIIKYRFRPRILIDVSKIDMTTTVLGFKISMPIMIAPTAMQKMAHPEGMQVILLKLLPVLF